MNDETIYNKLSQRSGQPPPNYDVEAGIHYGVIPTNSVSDAAMEDVYENGTDLGYEWAKEEAKASVAQMAELLAEEPQKAGSAYIIVKSETSDWLDADDRQTFVADYLDADHPLTAEECWADLEDKWSEAMSMSEMESGPYEYDDGESIVKACNDGDMFVIKSKYYTLAAMCSPCAPNAGYCNTPGSLKTYCLGPDWFNEDEYSPLPYDVYNVETGELVAKAKEGE